MFECKMSIPPIRIGVSPWPPAFNPCFLNAERDADCLPGIELDILLILLRHVGVESYTLHTSDEIGCGWLQSDENGKVIEATGLMKMLLNGTIDVIGNACGFHKERIAKFDPTWPVIFSPEVFVMKHPNVYKVETGIFTPFRKE